MSNDSNSMVTTKISKGLNFLEISDVHLGHHRTKTPRIIDGLYKLLPDNEETRQLDLIIIAGDLFDRLLQKNDEWMWMIEIWAMWLLRKCAKYGIVLRILEGTPSHDWKQSRMFITYNQGAKFKADVRYVETLEYEWHPTLGISLLYLPDEWHPDLLHCYKEAKRCLAENGVDKADVIVMHGQFEYQLPEHVGIEFHDSRAWQDLVNHFIFCGHIHQTSQRGKILVAGSFDRLTHGDENPKGYLRGTIRSDGQNAVRFVENTMALQYKTIDCRGLSVHEAMILIERSLNLPEGSFIRIEANSDDNVAGAIPVLKEQYPQFFWDNPKIHSVGLDRLTTSVLAMDRYVPIDLTKDNLSKLMEERLRKRQLTEAQISRAKMLITGGL